MSVKRYVFYEMFKFICGKSQVTGMKEKKNKQSQKKNIIKPANLATPTNPTDVNKISPETMNKIRPKIEDNFYIERKLHTNVNKFIQNYNEINKTNIPPKEE